MHFYWRGLCNSFVALIVTLLSVSIVYAQENYRIHRSSSDVGPGSSVDPSVYQSSNYIRSAQGPIKPLEGGVEHKIDLPPAQMRELSGQTDSNLLRGIASSGAQSCVNNALP